MTRIGILGPSDREEVSRLSIRLAERSAEAVVLDSRRNPRIRMSRGTESACGEDLSGIRGIYVADLGLPASTVRREDGSLDREASARALASSRRRLAAWNALLERLAARGRVVNPPRTHDLHALKPWEASSYAAAQLPVPATVATSDPLALRDLPRDAPEGWIRKGMVGGYGYTEAFARPESVEEARSRLRAGPLMVQERIVGGQVRAFVLGGEVIGAAEVTTQDRDEVDSRRGAVRIRRIDLPEDAARAALAAVRRWGFHFAAVDFMVEAKTGRHYLLECNSAPFFLTFEKRTGIPVSSRLADYLLRRDA